MWYIKEDDIRLKKNGKPQNYFFLLYQNLHPTYN